MRLYIEDNDALDDKLSLFRQHTVYINGNTYNDIWQFVREESRGGAPPLGLILVACTAVYAAGDTSHAAREAGYSEVEYTIAARFKPRDHEQRVLCDNTKAVSLALSGLFRQPPVAPNNGIIVWVDGSCRNNGKPGAVAGIGINYPSCPHRNVSASLTWGRMTNNRAELSAILYVLCTNPGSLMLTICTDSNYSIHCINKYCHVWKKNGWITAKGNPVESNEIIQRICSTIQSRRRMGGATVFCHVKAHGIDVHNNEADRLANIATSCMVVDPIMRFMVRRCGVPI